MRELTTLTRILLTAFLCLFYAICAAGRADTPPPDTAPATQPHGYPHGPGNVADGSGPADPHPASPVFDHIARIHSIIFICDGSGSMMGNKIDVLKVELRKSIDSLQPSQEFDCMFFLDPTGDRTAAFMAAGNGGMLHGTPGDKKTAIDFLDSVIVHGSTNPIPALEQAFKEDPVLIYLLTDGEFDDPDSDVVAAKIAELNAGKKVRVNTILFLATQKEAEENKEFETVMTKIATDNGGHFREFYADQL
jgi:hypothetical protein